jgi:hypothetical protein
MIGTLAIAVAGGLWMAGARASDHDDGETELKGRNLNLTDLYCFREDWQTGNAGDNGNLVFVMCANPRSVARQQYYWSTGARYEFHVGRLPLASVNGAAPGTEQFTLRFEFGAPDGTNRQPMTVTAIRDGAEFAATVGARFDNGVATGGTESIKTTPIGGAGAYVHEAYDITLGGSTLRVHSGHHEDPFFFDVESYFRVRAALAGIGPAAAFKPTTTAADFTAGYNVNAIVVRVPIAFVQGASTDPVFDVWETISVRQ